MNFGRSINLNKITMINAQMDRCKIIDLFRCSAIGIGGIIYVFHVLSLVTAKDNHEDRITKLRGKTLRVV